MSTHNERLMNDLIAAVGANPNDLHIDALTSDEAKAISDATIVEGDDTDEGNDPIIQAMSNAVNTPSIGSMPNLGLNWGTGGDAALTEYFNRGI